MAGGGLDCDLAQARDALVAHLNTHAPPRCSTSQYCRTLSPSQCCSGMILLTLCSMVWDWRVSRAGSMPFYWPSCSLHFLSSPVFSFSSFLVRVIDVLLGSLDNRALVTLSQSCIAGIVLIIIIIIIIIIT